MIHRCDISVSVYKTDTTLFSHERQSQQHRRLYLGHKKGLVWLWNMTHRSRDRDYNDRYKDRDERRHDKHRRTSSRRSPERKLEGGEYRDGSRSRHHRSSNSERRRRKDSSRERVRHRSRSRCRSRENHERNHRGSHRSSSSRHNSMYRSNRRRTRKKESDYESSSDDSSSTNSSSSGGYKSKPKVNGRQSLRLLFFMAMLLSYLVVLKGLFHLTLVKRLLGIHKPKSTLCVITVYLF